MHPVLNIAVRAARQAGNTIIQNYDGKIYSSVENYNGKENIINTIQYTIYKKMINIIHKAYPNHFVYTIHDNFQLNTNKIYWIINTLDGIINFKKKIPHFCLSIAVIIKNKIETSLIYDPLKNELFSSIRGKGAQLNGYRMRCSEVNVLKNSMIGINIPTNNKFDKINYFKIIEFLLSNNINYISSGSSVLNLAYLASGRLDGLFDLCIEQNNFFSGALQIRESGGIISELTGNCYNNLHSKSVIIGNSKLLRIIVSDIKGKKIII
ncbi:inositol monophosphatase family protein [Buchnera aphidicola (Formosaphis micheliae)]|uniref:inositol monophosphatase family protein n=1 Tax=Buchnera aphidicola TaxID=9 RepID=UPI0031CC39D1